MTTKLIHVNGRVQGVGFRYFTRQKAQMHNITGFVTNKPDGSVYIEATGEENDIDVFVDYIRIGPSMARVQELDIQDYKVISFIGFSIR